MQAEELLSRCRWDECIESFEGLSGRLKGQHVQSHINARCDRCCWSTCRQVVDSPKALRSHLAATHGVPYLDEDLAQPAHTSYCFECREYFGADEWSHHCQTHLTKLVKFCGLTVQRSILIVAFRCPFCLGNTSLPPAMRYNQYDTQAYFARHVRSHYPSYFGQAPEIRGRPPSPCPHPQCSTKISSRAEFEDHCCDVHGLSSAVTKAQQGNTAVSSQQSNSNGNTDAEVQVDSDDEGDTNKKDSSNEVVESDCGPLEYICYLPSWSDMEKPCMRACVNKATLKKHQAAHVRKAPLLCTPCRVTFRHFRSLRFHNLVVHRQEKQYRCDCGAAYDASRQLQLHAIIHDSTWQGP